MLDAVLVSASHLWNVALWFVGSVWAGFEFTPVNALLLLFALEALFLVGYLVGLAARTWLQWWLLWLDLSCTLMRRAMIIVIPLTLGTIGVIAADPPARQAALALAEYWCPGCLQLGKTEK